VSDHGESLGENNIYLHGLPYAIAPKEQIEVPMVIWMSENMKEYDYIDYDCMKKDAKEKTYSHDNIFHSISSLLEINTTLYDKSYDIFQNCRTKELPY
jgi:lipid A ethanolaminephosphotransferase